MNSQYTFTITTEERDEIKMYATAVEAHCAIEEARNEIRSRLKHGDGVTDEEERTLERIRELLHIGD